MVRRGETSHTKILRQVRPGTTVLECGPGDGIMTRYLKETLGCHIYILENDPDSFNHASRYADAGSCADLEQDAWLTVLKDASFDYILFADVLEHLRDPLAVLRKMKRLLKPDGSVLLSVPNITNGDIIMNMLCDRFTYTPLGLLDNTHLHFFARHDLREMIRVAGYYLASEACTRVPLFASEQGVFIPQSRRNELERALEVHPNSRVYQYVCRLSLTETATESDVEEAWNEPQVLAQSRFYFDLGEGYNETNRSDVLAETLPDGRLYYHVELPEGCSAVRYDPVEMHRCILHDLQVFVDGHSLQALPLNGLSVERFVFFNSEDPQVSILIPKSGQQLRLETELQVLSSGSWGDVYLIMTELKGKLEQAEAMVQVEISARMKLEQSLSIAETTLISANRAQIWAEDKAAKLGTQYEEMNTALIAKTHELESLVNSKSWKMTQALRTIKRALYPKSR